MFTFDACTIHPQGLNTPFLLADQLSTFGCELLAHNLLLLFVETQQGNVLLAQVPHDSCVRAVFLNYLGVWWLWYSWRTNVIGQAHLFSGLSQPQLSFCLQYILLLQAIKAGVVRVRLHLIGQMLHAC